jgi:hypothetical protein
MIDDARNHEREDRKTRLTFALHAFTLHSSRSNSSPVSNKTKTLDIKQPQTRSWGWEKGRRDVNNSFGARKKLGNLQRQGIIIGALGVRSHRKSRRPESYVCGTCELWHAMPLGYHQQWVVSASSRCSLLNCAVCCRPSIRVISYGKRLLYRSKHRSTPVS